jgi:nucleoside-triphosphatase THEP1
MMAIMKNRVNSVTMENIRRIYASDDYVIVRYIDGLELKSKYASVAEANDACLDLIDQVNKYRSSEWHEQKETTERIATALEKIADQLSPDLIDMVWGRK